jgi:hypothetical protein
MLHVDFHLGATHSGRSLCKPFLSLGDTRLPTIVLSISRTGLPLLLLCSFLLLDSKTATPEIIAIVAKLPNTMPTMVPADRPEASSAKDGRGGKGALDIGP